MFKTYGLITEYSCSLSLRNRGLQLINFVTKSAAARLRSKAISLRSAAEISGQIVTLTEKVGEEEGFLWSGLPLPSLTSKDFCAGIIGNKYLKIYGKLYIDINRLGYGVGTRAKAKSMENCGHFGHHDPKAYRNIRRNREGRYPSYRDRESGEKEIVNGVD